MHRHGYIGRKFHREKDQRQALIKSLAEALIIHESIETTLPKAKELVPYFEQIITKAKVGDLHSRRQVINATLTVSSANKLVDEIAPKLRNRSSGYLKIEKAGFRRGDHSPIARVGFVDDLKQKPKVKQKSSSASSASQKGNGSNNKSKPKSKTAVNSSKDKT